MNCLVCCSVGDSMTKSLYQLNNKVDIHIKTKEIWIHIRKMQLCNSFKLILLCGLIYDQLIKGILLDHVFLYLWYILDTISEFGLLY